MRSHIVTLLLLFAATVIVNAQYVRPSSLNIGDPAPKLRVGSWLKGAPILEFEKGKIYVLEFWATWCTPCIIAMPHLSKLANKYREKVTFVGIDIHEKKAVLLKQVKAFVDSMGWRMDYLVAVEDTNFTVADWFGASGEEGIPLSFVVDAEGRLSWIGNPTGLDNILQDMLDGKWNIKEAMETRNFNKYLEALDNSANERLNNYGYSGKGDSALFLINEMVRKEPKLKYSPSIGYYTFAWLLTTNAHDAYKYGKILLNTSTYDDPPYNSVIGAIDWNTEKIDLPLEIYELCSEAHQMKLQRYSETINIPNTYRKMADWYLRAGKITQAIEAQQKAVDALQSRKDFSETEMAGLKYCLEEYKKLIGLCI